MKVGFVFSLSLITASTAARSSRGMEKATSDRRRLPSPMLRARYCMVTAGVVRICRAISVGGKPCFNSSSACCFFVIHLSMPNCRFVGAEAAQPGRDCDGLTRQSSTSSDPWTFTLHLSEPAKVAELADAPDLGSGGVTHESSSLSFRTKLQFPVPCFSVPSNLLRY